jgi:REP element-mobilizing transposase RayT
MLLGSKYHLIWIPKYRFKILREKVGKELYEQFIPYAI